MTAILLSLVMALQATQPAVESTTPPEAVDVKPAAEVPLAVQIFEAHGGPSWNDVTRLRFTFNVTREGQPVMVATHDWDVKSGIDKVTVDGETTEVNVYDPADTPEAQAAFQRWTNDSYWLLAPIKLLDGGVLASELPATDQFQRLLVQFENVGLTPGDRYLYRIDPETKQVLGWDYLPAEGSARTFKWSGYQEAGPLNLALDHETEDGFRVFFTDVSAETAE